MKTLGRLIVAGLAIAVVGTIASAMAGEPPAREGKRLLEQLVKGARNEGRLTVTMVAGVDEREFRDLTTMFNRRFGLNTVFKRSPDLGGKLLAKVLGEIGAGITPTIDVYHATGVSMFDVKEAGALKRIDNWEPLLSEIAPEAYKVKEKVSFYPLDGYAFVWHTRANVLLWNPKLMSEKELPRTWKGYGDAKYKGKFAVPNYTSRALAGIMVYDKEEWLQAVRNWGRNSAYVLTFRAGLDRMLLGELAFMFSNDLYYFETKAPDPNAPIGMAFFEDFTFLEPVTFAALKGTRNPNTAALFSLWVASQEAQLFFDKIYHLNLYAGTGSNSRQMLKTLKERNIKTVGWTDKPEYLEKLKWLNTTPEGRKYQEALAAAQLEGK